MSKKRSVSSIGRLSKKFSGLLLAALAFVAGYQVRERMIAPLPVSVAEGNIHVRFSPQGGCTSLAIQTIKKAKGRIDGSIYSFNSVPIADALLAAHRRGVKVRILADRSQRNVKNGQLPRLDQAGVPIRIARGVKSMHNKVLIIDGSYVLTGSFNWTRPGEEKNAENLLCIKSNLLAAHYKKDLEKHWAKAKPYVP